MWEREKMKKLVRERKRERGNKIESEREMRKRYRVKEGEREVGNKEWEIEREI